MKNFKVYTPEEIEKEEKVIPTSITTYLHGEDEAERDFGKWSIKELGYELIEDEYYAKYEEVYRMSKSDFLFDRVDLKEERDFMSIPPLTLSNEEFAILFFIANGEIEPGYFFGPISYLTRDETDSFFIESSLPQRDNDVLQCLKILEKKDYLKMKNIYGSHYEIELKDLDEYMKIPTYLLIFLESIAMFDFKNILEIDFLKLFAYCYCECDKMSTGQSLIQFGLSEEKIFSLMFILLRNNILRPQMRKASDGSEFIVDFVLDFNALSNFGEEWEDAESELFSFGTDIKVVK